MEKAQRDARDGSVDQRLVADAVFFCAHESASIPKSNSPGTAFATTRVSPAMDDAEQFAREALKSAAEALPAEE